MGTSDIDGHRRHPWVPPSAVLVRFRLTLRLLLRQAFFFRNSNLMARVNRLCEDCPTFLDAILPHIDRRELAPMADEPDFELVTYYRDHQIAAVIGHIFILSISKVLPSNPLHLTALVADVRFFTRDFPRYIFARSHYLWQGDGIDRSYIYYSCG